MAKFTPMSDEDIAKAGLLPEGVYDFEITACNEYQNKKGNDIFKMDLNVFDSTGKAHSKRDWITPAFIKKFKHCIDACGLVDKYNAGEIIETDFIGKSGKCKITIGEPNDDNIRYNQVEDYIKRANTAMPKSVDEDLIPF